MLSGINGIISKGTAGGGAEAVIGNITGWGVNLTGQSAEVKCSGAKQGVIRLPGGKDWTGRYGAIGPTPAVWPGDLVQFAGSIAGVDGKGVIGDVLIDSVEITWDCEGSKDISHNVNFSGDGAMTIGDSVTPDDTTVPAPVSSTGCTLTAAPAAAVLTYAAIAEIRTMTLTVSRANVSGRSSGGSGWSNRGRGHLDARLTASVYIDETDGWGLLPTQHTFYALKAGAGGATFWLLKWMELLDISGMDVDVASGAFIGANLSFGFSGYTLISTTWTEGALTDPATVTRWPEA